MWHGPAQKPASIQSEMQGIVGGKLKLKGVDKKCATDIRTQTITYPCERGRLTCCRTMVMRCVARKKKKKHTKEKEQAAAAAMADGSAMLAAQPTTAPGSGTILTSGTSVMGKGTQFTEEVHAGDTITVTNESTLVDETRRVTMVLGPTAMALSAPFASDVITYSDFTVTSMPRSTEGEPKQAGVRIKDSGSRELVWREVKGFSYKIHREKIKKTSTQDLLDMRCKKKADRMCM